MDEKTEELRDIFLDVADEETVTESQEELRGSVTDDRESVGEAVAEVVEKMRDRFSFETGLDDEALEQVVRLFYDNATDGAIAEEVGCSEPELFRARVDLHLVRDDDPPGVDAPDEVWEAIRTSTDDAATLADELGLDAEAVERVQRVVAARNRSRRVSHRFRTAFEEQLTDADLKGQFAAETRRDGLDGATEDADVDVDF